MAYLRFRNHKFTGTECLDCKVYGVYVLGFHVKGVYKIKFDKLFGFKAGYRVQGKLVVCSDRIMEDT